MLAVAVVLVVHREARQELVVPEAVEQVPQITVLLPVALVLPTQVAAVVVDQLMIHLTVALAALA